MCEYPHMFKQSKKKLDTISSSENRSSLNNFNTTGYSSFSKAKTVSTKRFSIELLQNKSYVADAESMLNKTFTSQFSAALPSILEQKR